MLHVRLHVSTAHEHGARARAPREDATDGGVHVGRAVEYDGTMSRTKNLETLANLGLLLLTDLLAGAVPASWWRWLRNAP
jgi:hypothetical protein